MCIFAGLLVDKVRAGSIFLSGVPLASVLITSSCGFTWGKKRVCVGMRSPDFSWSKVMPSGNSYTPGCFLPDGICAGGHVLEMFI